MPARHALVSSGRLGESLDPTIRAYWGMTTSTTRATRLHAMRRLADLLHEDEAVQLYEECILAGMREPELYHCLIRLHERQGRRALALRLKTSLRHEGWAAANEIIAQAREHD